MEEKSDFKNIDEYISRFPETVQNLLNSVRVVIRQAAPAATETIKYRMPTYVLHENLVHFAAYDRHLGFYPTPSAIEHFKEELTPYTWSKGAVQFPIDLPIPYDLVRRMTEYRVQEILTKVAAKKR